MMNEKKYLDNDDAVISFSTYDEMQQYLDFRKENDEWLKEYINDLACYGIPNYSLFVPGNCTNIEIDKVAYKMKIEDIDFEAANNKECIANECLFIVANYNGKMIAIPTRPLAFNSICQRADLFCGTMTRSDEKTNKLILPIDEKAKWITRAFQLYGDLCKILYRDGKISAVLSKDYQILPCDELIDVLEKKLKMTYPNILFESGMANHEFFVARYALNDKTIEETLRLKLNDYGSDINSVKVGVQFNTSDVGLSSVNANIYITLDGVNVFLDGISMPHKGDASIERFDDLLSDFDLVLQEAEERVEELGNMDIKDVKCVVELVTKAYSTIFPKTATEEVLLELTGAGTGIDVFIALNDIINRHVKNNNINPTRFLNMTEMLYKLIKIPFDKLETGEFSLKK